MRNLFIHGTKNKKNSAKGFTLIELLVVISIIGFLASVVMSSLQSARERALDAQIKSDLSQIRNALELYAIDHGYTYPVPTLATYQEGDVYTIQNKSTQFVESLMSFFTQKVYAQGARPANCERFDALSSALVPIYIGAMPQHPLDTGADVCYQYFVNTAGNTAVAYAPLVTEQYSEGFSRQAGIVVGVTDVPALRAICDANLAANSGNSAPFPLFTDSDDRCAGQIADIVLGVENGTGDIAVGESCTLSQYTTQSACEMDRSSCSDNQYTSAGQTVCEANGSTSQGTCSGGSAYTRQTDCEEAGYYAGGTCSGGSYSNQSECENAQCVLTEGYCNGDLAYTDSASCVSAGYTESSCTSGGYNNQTDCESAQCELMPGYCSDGMFSDSSSCLSNGYEWTDASFGSCGYGWNQGSPAYGYTWVDATTGSCDYQWTQGEWMPYNYSWTDGVYTPNVWTAVPGGQWGQY